MADQSAAVCGCGDIVGEWDSAARKNVLYKRNPGAAAVGGKNCSGSRVRCREGRIEVRGRDR